MRYISDAPNRRIDDIQRIADRLYEETPGTDPFWASSARSLFTGIALYLAETPSLLKTIGEVRRQGMAGTDEGFSAHWRRIIEGRKAGRWPLSDECVRCLNDVIDLAPVTASSVRKTFTSRLDLWASPVLDAATSADDFDLRDLRRRPMSIYVATAPDDLSRIRPVLNLFFQQCIGEQTRELPEHNLDLRHAVLVLLNEFTALGQIPILSKAPAYLTGYNVRVLLVIQALSQLREVYGVHAADSMQKSVAARVVFAPKDFNDAKEVSDELGITTVKARSHSRPTPLAIGASRDRNQHVTTSDHSRALLLPQEVKEMGANTALIFLETVRPIRCKKIRYYSDKRFKNRVLPPPERPTSILPLVSVRSPASAVEEDELPPVGDGFEQGLDGDYEAERFRRQAELIDSIPLEEIDERLAEFEFTKVAENAHGSEFDVDVARFRSSIQ